ncbi:MAG: hypothetical protein JXR83_13780, partial [Deltaproteobacteria bacterium]|nr:hypothetical protein [Deltaproteobacteria bacterium]
MKRQAMRRGLERALICAAALLAASGSGCGPLTPLDDGAAAADDLVLYLGGALVRLQRRDALVDEVPTPAPVSIRGKSVQPLLVLRPAAGLPFDPEQLPRFPRSLVIATTEELARSSALLPEYIRWKQANGWRVVVGTETAWNRPTSDDGDDRPARIRAWLKDLYAREQPG